jgi:hypothetical protein
VPVANFGPSHILVLLILILLISQHGIYKYCPPFLGQIHAKHPGKRERSVYKGNGVSEATFAYTDAELCSALGVVSSDMSASASVAVSTVDERSQPLTPVVSSNS